jgi:hypothetical protein
MRRAARLAVLASSWLLAGFAVSAQTDTAQVSPPAAPSCSISLGALHDFVAAGPGAPYSALREFSHSQTLADGTIISSKPATDKVYRDSQGRERIEHTVCRRRDEQGGIWVEIEDPVSHSAYILDAATHTAHRYAIKVHEHGTRWGPSPPSTATPAHATNSTTESLGSQTMEGVPVDGMRSTRVISVGQMDNDRPFNVVDETWTSPQFHIVVLTKYSDPRMGESTTRLTNIELTEPDPVLFQVPPDYTVTDESGAILKLTFPLRNAPEK